MRKVPLTGRQQAIAFGVCALAVVGLLVPVVHSAIEGMVKPGGWILIPFFVVGLLIAVPLTLFFQSTLGLLVGALFSVLGRLLAPVLPRYVTLHPVNRVFATCVKVLVFAASIGVLVCICRLASKDAGGRAGQAAREWSQRMAGRDGQE